MATNLSDEIASIESFTWTYTESGNGKCSPDGIGPTCKKTAYFVINFETDINNIEQFVKVIQQRYFGITCIAIDGKDIQTIADKIEKESVDQKGFEGTLNVHQIAAVYFISILGFQKGSCKHYKIGSINFALKHKWKEVFTNSEPEDLECAKPELNPIPNKSPHRLDDDMMI
ncbi:hypothetical protein HHI36_001877 [Cryptolaemus montrouzieri]|uniref:Uncharacterized protein n=1 Tax=Cryptolaemus montrouzieri TaxID=559131 RepID=A0ABD2P8S2_9CUCU